jgi:hypothetical protein
MLLYKQFKDDFERENQVRFCTQAKKSRAGRKKK